MRLTTKTTKWMLFLGLPALLVLAFGCGLDRAPVAQEEETLAPAEGVVLLAFTPEGARAAAKRLQDGRTVSALFDEQGGLLELNEDNGSGGRDDLRVRLEAGRGALTGPVTITMTVYGQTLSTLMLEFAPGGLVFRIPAQLTVDLGWDKVDMPLADLVVWHVHDNGKVEKVPCEVYKLDVDRVRIVTKVPGFSRYAPYEP